MAGVSSGERGRDHSDTAQGFRRTLAGFGEARGGATGIEYGILASMIAIGLMVALQTFPDKLNGIFQTISTAMRAS